jgi:hypothetical protein
MLASNEPASQLLSWRTAVEVCALGFVEAAMWALTEDLPRWFLWATIPIGLLFVIALNLGINTQTRLTRWSPWGLGILYVALLGYAFRASFASALGEHIETVSMFYRANKNMTPIISAILTLTNNGLTCPAKPYQVEVEKTACVIRLRPA